MKSPCLSKPSRGLFDLTWGRRHNAQLMVWSEEKGEERVTVSLGNDLKCHWIRCSVKYHRYPLTESKLNHRSFTFHIRSVTLSLWFIFMGVLAGDERSFSDGSTFWRQGSIVWFLGTVMTSPWVYLSLRVPIATTWCFVALWSYHKDTFSKDKCSVIVGHRNS